MSWLKRGSGSFLRWMPPIGAFASVVIAVVAIVIAVLLHTSQQKQLMVDRSLSLHRTYVTLDSYQTLSLLSKRQAYELNRSSTHSLTSQQYRALIRSKFEMVTTGKRDKVRAWIEEVLVSSGVVYQCAWVMMKCDKDILFQSYLVHLSELFFPMRHGIYCDDHIFGGGQFRNSSRQKVLNVEVMIIDYLRWDFAQRNEEVPIFLTHEERDGRPGIVVRPLLPDFCEAGELG